MNKPAPFDEASLAKFDAAYDTSHEATALRTRGIFIREYPSRSLRKLTLDNYVIGHHNSKSFCYLVESGTKAWAYIGGATSRKFGVYFGRMKHDPTRKYRFAAKFGMNENSAFVAVKTALLDLVSLGSKEHLEFEAIDANPLSQMFKAKILSLYYPERFLAICSAENLEMIAGTLGLEDSFSPSQCQNFLIRAKRRNPVTRKWSAPKFMTYLYRSFVRAEGAIESPLEKPHVKKHRRVDFEEMQKQRAEIGRAAEEYALEWERERLVGAELEHLIGKIDDRRERPSYGHDFLSWSAKDEPRYIEVKCVAKLDDGHRFFLSENEHETSLTKEHRDGYFFYLVFLDSGGNPSELLAVLAHQLYPNADLAPSSYEVRFDRKRLED